jgi:hypothetical protein
MRELLNFSSDAHLFRKLFAQFVKDFRTPEMKKIHTCEEKVWSNLLKKKNRALFLPHRISYTL